MPHLSFWKKLLPVKRAWRSLRSNLTKLKNSKLIKTTNHRILSSRLLYRLFKPFKHRCLTRTSSFRHFHKTRAPIYIDELYDLNISTYQMRHGYHEKGETSKANDKEDRVTTRPEKKIERVVDRRSGPGHVGHDVDEVWRSIVAASPQLRPVDERAGDFISKFKEDMRIQRERSILEFQEMLKRSA